jgi:hypothetical protein
VQVDNSKINLRGILTTHFLSDPSCPYFFIIEIALRFAQDNLDVKKVLAPSKNPAKWLIMCFSRIKNIKSRTSKNSGTLIVTGIIYISGRAQSRIGETPVVKIFRIVI